MSENRTAKGFHLFLFSLAALAGLASEGLYAYLLEPAIYGRSMGQWDVTQNICHWIITSVTWGLIGFFIVKYANKYDTSFFKNKGNIKAWQWLVTAACIILVLASQFIDWNGFKVIQEFYAKGIIKFVFQYIYYFFETFLFMLIIIFGQRACELWFKRETIPYGGVIVALTWGMAHWATKGLLAGIALGRFRLLLWCSLPSSKSKYKNYIFGAVHYVRFVTI
ncbi:hypothetical protein [Clostridium sp. KNHs216]|uniref:hypothetical protein n=1 Tax=Clostridium sp. KNHs216 TaxID=1550235 RepID=UPI0011529FAE|nr:hypothetical protein [Clostridium sp. KNHs216]TQI66300.1 hypothetical protein LY85_0964 [Clostridium sp. KNHs216]